MTTYYCNFNCICTKTVCENKHHFATLDERKFACSIYNLIPDIKEFVKEENPEKRKMSCFHGQLCTKKDCGFRHYLNPEGRDKFNFAMNFAKTLKKEQKSETSPELEKRVEELEQLINQLSLKIVKMELNAEKKEEKKDWSDEKEAD